MQARQHCGRLLWLSASGFSSKPSTLQRSRSLTETIALRQLRKARRVARLVLGGSQFKAGDLVQERSCRALIELYPQMPSNERSNFIHMLSRSYRADPDSIAERIQEWQEAQNEGDVGSVLATQRRLRQTLVPDYEVVFRQIKQLTGGMKFLVDFRADLLQERRRSGSQELLSLERDLREMLFDWFLEERLELRRLTWKHTPAEVLQKIVHYERVHQIGSLENLKQRLGHTRRLFCFTHPNIPDEPLVFVQVALTTEISSSVQQILELDTSGPVLLPEEASTAIFYSISSTQDGLRGIDLGNHLIKRVVAQLRSEFSNLDTFSTLSPVPGLCSYLHAQALAGEELLAPSEAEALAPHCSHPELSGTERLSEILKRPGWSSEPELAAVVHPILMKAAAAYLTGAKREGRILDPVGNFHVRNGASVWRLNWMGDTSANGMKQSGGVMVNYRYELGTLESNTSQYTKDGVVATSDQLMSLIE